MASGWALGMSNGRWLTLVCDWPTGLRLNPERCLPNDATSSGCWSVVVADGGLKLGLWFLGFEDYIFYGFILLHVCMILFHVCSLLSMKREE